MRLLNSIAILKGLIWMRSQKHRMLIKSKTKNYLHFYIGNIGKMILTWIWTAMIVMKMIKRKVEGQKEIKRI